MPPGPCGPTPPAAASGGSTLEPLGHPDLAALGRRLRREMDETLEAEQSAARAAARRRRTLRDLFLTLEDRADLAAVWALDGRCYRGRVQAVGVDHVALASADGTRVLALAHVVAVEVLP
ncbi:MAG: hypothetical protein FJW79_02760 [Actinobacteria bacterium]|nr:hypothetical protein [Actinomycetota bacterium]